MKDFWKYWTLFTAMFVMPLNGYLLGAGKIDIIFVIILCIMQFPVLSNHILKDK